tara:strand:+ start:1493 stop:2044 length:552 start_codon:yes stop_codon:yes gene_type:complete
MENKQPLNKIDSRIKETEPQTSSEVKKVVATDIKANPSDLANSSSDTPKKADKTNPPKKPAKPPKVEDKPFREFITKHLVPDLKSSIETKGILVEDIELIEGQRPVVGGRCWMVFCQISNQRRFWLCFNKDSITSDKTILLAESNSEPSIVESFLIDEKKTTLPLLISRVLQRLNGQKWIGMN